MPRLEIAGGQTNLDPFVSFFSLSLPSRTGPRTDCRPAVTLGFPPLHLDGTDVNSACSHGNIGPYDDGDERQLPVDAGALSCGGCIGAHLISHRPCSSIITWITHTSFDSFGVCWQATLATSTQLQLAPGDGKPGCLLLLLTWAFPSKGSAHALSACFPAFLRDLRPPQPQTTDGGTGGPESTIVNGGYAAQHFPAGPYPSKKLKVATGRLQGGVGELHLESLSQGLVQAEAQRPADGVLGCGGGVARPGLGPEDGDLGDVDGGAVAEGPGGGELAVGVGELHKGGGAALVQADAVVQRHDHTAAEEQRDVSEVLVSDRGVATGRVDPRARVPVVEDVVGKVDVDAGAALLRYWRHEQGVTVEVLQLQAKRLLVLRVEVEDGVEQRCPVDGLLVQRRIDVIEQPVADIEDLAGGLGDRVPAVELLRDIWNVPVVVSEEGLEGSEQRPTGTDDRLSPSQWPTFVPAPAKVERVMIRGRSSGRRVSMASWDATDIMDPYRLFLLLLRSTLEDKRLYCGLHTWDTAGRAQGDQAAVLAPGGHGDQVAHMSVPEVGLGVTREPRDCSREYFLTQLVQLRCSPSLVAGNHKASRAADAAKSAQLVAEVGCRWFLPARRGYRRGSCRQSLRAHSYRSTGRRCRPQSPGQRRGRTHCSNNALPDGAVLAQKENVILDSAVEGWVVIVGGGWVNYGNSMSVQILIHAASLTRIFTRLHSDRPAFEDTSQSLTQALKLLSGPREKVLGCSENNSTKTPAGSTLDFSHAATRTFSPHPEKRNALTHHNVMLVILVQLLDKLLHQVKREPLRVEGEDPAELHVIDVGPHGLQGDGGLAVVVDDLGDVVDVLIAVAALVIPKTPVRHHSRQAGDLGVLARGVQRARASDEVEVEDAAERVVLEEDAMSAGGAAVLEVDRVVSVQVGTVGNSIRVLGPQRADVVGGVEAEGVRVLAQAAQILRLEDEAGCRGVEENLARVGARDIEGEGRLDEAELQGGCGVTAGAGGRPREDGLRDLVDGVGGILDLDMDSRGSLIGDLEGQAVQVVPVHIARRPCQGQIGCEARGCSLHI
ncbi:hypothetical protein FJTKL_14124 [Diaporthe vaccinii]|uniref:Uncharacterized protein n=1 Tax=Diaporthe vaccinii TaxID=105482 RepID=A0ABR4E992_9PEZI